MRAVIFDIDGTLADCTHRLHHVTNGNKRWDEFFGDMGNDGCYLPIKKLFVQLEDKNHIVLCSGRPENYRQATEDWLEKQDLGGGYQKLYMRPEGDYRPDHVVKRELLDRMRADGFEPWLVVDDRPTVVAMWREAGLTCLQCRDWNEDHQNDYVKPALLTLMVGPSGAGKSTWLNYAVENSPGPEDLGIGGWDGEVISSDQLRHELCGDFRDQSKNEQVFAALHALVKARLHHGLPVVVDATNLRRKDRLANVALQIPGGPVRYVVLNRPMEEKRRDAGWRADVKDKDGKPFDLLARHEEIFRSNLKDILAGDGLPNVAVVDLRK